MKVKIGKYPKKNNRRKISVEIESFDTWSFDHTLAYIIYPALLQLRETKMGIPSDFAIAGGEDYMDQQSFDFYKDTNQECFEIRCQQWNEVLDKMIWSFHQLIIDDYSSQYYHGDIDWDWVECDKLYPNPISGKMEPTYQMVDKNPDGHWLDAEGLRLHEDRIQEGLELFGKYFRSLWD